VLGGVVSNTFPPLLCYSIVVKLMIHGFFFCGWTKKQKLSRY